MIYWLFLDDIHTPASVTKVTLPKGPWVIARSYDDFVRIIEANGIPEFISFDHDLADEHYVITGVSSEAEKNGARCARWLAERCVRDSHKLPEYVIHSQNPIGVENIHSIMKSAARILSGQ